MINIIITDDEKSAREVMELMLQTHFPEINIVEKCEDLPQTIKAIQKLKPDAIFLDIEMPGYNGLEILDFFNEEDINFELIFVTAYSEFAIRAFKLSAIDYLLKPVMLDDLFNAVEKLKKNILKRDLMDKLSTLKNNLDSESARRICIPSSEGNHIVAVNDIIYFSADGSYTRIFLKDKANLYVAKKLKYFEDVLTEDKNFIRLHRSFMVNLKYITRYKKGDFAVTLENGESIAVSREKSDDLVKILGV